MYFINAKVKSTNGRVIQVESETLPPEFGDVQPLQFGNLKVKTPDVGDAVTVIVYDKLNRIKYYLPCMLEDDSDEDSEYTLLTKETSGFIALADPCNTNHDDIKAVLDDYLTQYNAHTHVAPPTGGATSVPSALFTEIYVPSDVDSDEVKSK